MASTCCQLPTAIPYKPIFNLDFQLCKPPTSSDACSSRVPSSSLQKSLAHTADDHTTSSAAVTPAGKKFPWKNVPPWSPLYRKLQLHSTTSLHNPTVDMLHAGSDSLGSTLTELEPLPDSRVHHRISNPAPIQLWVS